MKLDQLELTTLLSLRRGARLLSVAALCGLVGALAGCGGEDETGGAEVESTLVVECVDAGEPPPEDSWICGEDRVVECGTHAGAQVGAIHAGLELLSVDATCDELELVASAEGPFAVGMHEVEVVEAEGPSLCLSRLTVVDTQPPRARGASLELWPPNHKLTWLTPEECALDATDACDPDVTVSLEWATSDELADATGDGATDQDIVDLGCDGIGLRAERDGGSDGRVYNVGYTVTDAAGNASEGMCTIVVRHDQGDDGPVQANVEAYRVELSGCP